MTTPSQPHGAFRQTPGQPPDSQSRSSQLPAQIGPAPHQVPLHYLGHVPSQPQSNPGLTSAHGAAHALRPIPYPYVRPPHPVSATVQRPYHAKRPHKKSRAGCHNCKARKVKCDEGRPRCRACTQRDEVCVYPNLYQAFAAASSSAPAHAPALTATAAVQTALPAATTANTGRARMPLDHQTIARPGSSNPSSNERRPLRHSPPGWPPEGFVYEGGDEDSHQAEQQAGVRRVSWQEHTANSRQRHGFNMLQEPMFRPKQFDETDMKVMWFYTIKGFHAFSSPLNRQPIVEEALQVAVPRYAFAHPFLMDCLLALTALEIRSLGQPIDSQRVLRYRAQAFSGYRRAVEDATPDKYPALLACSLLLIALASGQFRDPECPPLYILDWMVVWRGIGLIVKLIDPAMLQESGLAILFARPPIDMEASVNFVPNNLLLLLSPIGQDDPDYVHIDSYIETLKLLGSLYREIHAGLGVILFLRIITWFTFLPKGFVEAARKRRPIALIIIGHYLVFVKICSHIWWMRGISDKEIPDIKNALGDEWLHFYTVPLAAISVHGMKELRDLLLRPENWAPNSYYDAVRDSLVRGRGSASSGGEKVVYTGSWMNEDPGKAEWRNEDYLKLVKLRFNEDELGNMEVPITGKGNATDSAGSTEAQPQPYPQPHAESQHNQIS